MAIDIVLRVEAGRQLEDLIIRALSEIAQLSNAVARLAPVADAPPLPEPSRRAPAPEAPAPMAVSKPPRPEPMFAAPKVADERRRAPESWSPARLDLLERMEGEVTHAVMLTRLNALPGPVLSSQAIHNKRHRIKKAAAAETVRQMLDPGAPVAVTEETVPAPLAPPVPPVLPVPDAKTMPRPRLSDIAVPSVDDPFDAGTFVSREAKLGNAQAPQLSGEEYRFGTGHRSDAPDSQIIDANFADIRAWAKRHGVDYKGLNIGDVNRLRVLHKLPQVRLSMAARPVAL